MTFRSFAIYEYPEGTEIDLEVPWHDLVRAAGLPSLYDGPNLARWANDQALPITWIDNCWYRVTMSRGEFAEFLGAHIERGPQLPGQSELRLTCDRYMLEEEEF